MTHGRLALLLLLASGCDGPAIPAGWHTLITSDWILDPGAEQYPEQRFVAERDYTITAIRPIDPPGTHHVVLLREGAVHNVLFVAVLGTGAFTFPDGVGLRLRKGDALSLQLHLLNATAAPLASASGLEVIEVDPGAEVVETNILDPSLITLDLPPGPSSVSGNCTLAADQTLFAIGPHMHALGKHLRSTLRHGATTTVLLDQDFDWNAQVFRSLPSIAARAGDVITVECTYDNTTKETVHWGASASAEMCSAFVYRYPAGDSDFCIK